MSIQVRCNGCDGIIDTENKPWFEAAYFDPNEGEELIVEDEEGTSHVETQKVHHFCSADCVSTWGMRLSVEKWTGPVA